MDQDCKKVVKRWENLESDILMKIFQDHLSLNELIPGLAHVCRRWRAVCCDPAMWNTLDLSRMESNEQQYGFRCCDKEVIRILKLSMSLSKGNIRTLIFPLNLILTEDLLIYAVERCPNLRRLVIPTWQGITSIGISKALNMCENLESLTMPSIQDPCVIFSSIVKRREFRELQVLGRINQLFAKNLVKLLPELKVLCLKCISMDRDILIKILDELKSFEVLNISYSYMMVRDQHPVKRVIIVKKLDETIMKKASKLKSFLTCKHKVVSS